MVSSRRVGLAKGPPSPAAPAPGFGGLAAAAAAAAPPAACCSAATAAKPAATTFPTCFLNRSSPARFSSMATTAVAWKHMKRGAQNEKI